ncbi:MAG TPA: anti-sigma factor, partial [Kofleriaceae bacterium]|nr:anti-sigma factor [Kofleriaceae bacterium]
TELLVERALRPLDDGEHRELAELGCDGDESLDRAAAAVALAAIPVEPMPAQLADKLLAQAPLADLKRTLPGVVVVAARTTTAPPRSEPRPRRRIAPWIAAGVALAAAALLVVWWRSPRALSPADARAALIADAGDAHPIAWTAMADPTAHGASGDVVWSAREQRGYMRFVGLAPNDPGQFQYQLWIFDAERDEKFPVDGGVFDVSSTGEVIVPIAAKLHVTSATLFAVTVEKPGGVVVSRRERIVVTARS